MKWPAISEVVYDVALSSIVHNWCVHLSAKCILSSVNVAFCRLLALCAIWLFRISSQALFVCTIL